MASTRNYKEYNVWQESRLLNRKIYEITSLFPESERWGLASQLRRAAVSIPSNIAEGCGRTSDADFAHFLEVALGSAFEVETQLILAMDVGYLQEVQCEEVKRLLSSIQKQLTIFIKHIRNHNG